MKKSYKLVPMGNSKLLKTNNDFETEAEVEVELLKSKIANENLIRRQVRGEVIDEIELAESAAKASAPVKSVLDNILAQQATSEGQKQVTKVLKDLSPSLIESINQSKDSVGAALAAMGEKLTALQNRPDPRGITDLIGLLNDIKGTLLISLNAFVEAGAKDNSQVRELVTRQLAEFADQQLALKQMLKNEQLVESPGVVKEELEKKQDEVIAAVDDATKGFVEAADNDDKLPADDGKQKQPAVIDEKTAEKIAKAEGKLKLFASKFPLDPNTQLFKDIQDQKFDEVLKARSWPKDPKSILTSMSTLKKKIEELKTAPAAKVSNIKTTITSTIKALNKKLDIPVGVDGDGVKKQSVPRPKKEGMTLQEILKRNKVMH